MIDKEVYRTNFSVGGRDGPASGNSGNSGNTGGGGDARDRGMGMAGKTGDYGTGPTGNDGGGNQFTDLTKDVLNPNVDYVGPGVFGPTQKYSGDGLLSGYRNIDPLTGQPLSGLAYVGNMLSNVMSPSNIMGGILGLINPMAGLAFRGFNYLQDTVPQTIDQFRESNTLEEFRDKVRGYGRTMPVVSPTPGYGGIETLGVQPITPTENIMQVAELTKAQQKALNTQKMGLDTGLFTIEDIQKNIAPLNNPNSPATINEIKAYYGIV